MIEHRLRQIDDLHVARNRYVSAMRQMLLPEEMAAQSPDDQPFIFMCGDPFDFDMLNLATEFARQLDCDVIYLAFDAGKATLSRGNIHLVVARDGVCHVKRDCDLWLDRHGNHALLVPPMTWRGYFAFERSEIVHLPGKPATSLTGGIQRAKAEWQRRAAMLPELEARRCYDLRPLPAR